MPLVEVVHFGFLIPLHERRLKELLQVALAEELNCSEGEEVDVRFRPYQSGENEAFVLHARVTADRLDVDADELERLVRRICDWLCREAPIPAGSPCGVTVATSSAIGSAEGIVGEE